MPLQQGIHDNVPADVYHADPCPEPSLSAGIARKLVSRSPLHAWEAHPRLNPDHEDEEAGHLDFGSAAHALLLEGIDICQVVEADSWRTNAAKDERDSARKSGLIPLLRKDYERMCDLVLAVRHQVARLDVAPLPLHDGQPEQTLVWQEGDVWCRARPDWLHDAWDAVDDVKTTGTTANPADWARTRLFADGKDVQAAFYRRGLRHLAGTDPHWRFLVVEVDPPFAISVIGLSSAALELADRKVERAIHLWRRCMADGQWPGYSRELALAEPPAYEEARFLEAHYEEEVAA